MAPKSSAGDAARDFIMGGAVTAAVAYVAKRVGPEWGAFVDAIPAGVAITLLAVYLGGVTPEHLQTFAKQDAVARGTHALFAVVAGLVLATGAGLWKAFGWAALAWVAVVGVWMFAYFVRPR